MFPTLNSVNLSSLIETLITRILTNKVGLTFELVKNSIKLYLEKKYN